LQTRELRLLWFSAVVSPREERQTSLSPVGGKLMNAVLVRRKVMQYRGHDFQLEAEVGDLETEITQQNAGGKEYRRKRSIRTPRRKTAKSVSKHPGCGIGGRRNNRWTW
jgi:hypothetical protein